MLISIYQFEGIEYYDKHFDPEYNLVYVHPTATHFHFDFSANKKFTEDDYVHGLVESAEYAFLLLKRNSGNDAKKAATIIETITSYQVKSQQSPTYGLFPSAPEITDITILNNSTYYLAILFIRLMQNFKPLLPADTMIIIADALNTSAWHLTVSHNTLAYGYTYNQLIKVYILLECGKIFNNSDFTNFGLSILNNYYFGVLYNQHFWEYNPLFESYILSELLSRLRQSITEQYFIDIIDSLNDKCWESIAINFHPGMNVFTGPTADTGNAFMFHHFLIFLQKATGITFDSKLSNYQSDINSRCPAKYLNFFHNKEPNRFIRTLVGHGANYLYFRISKIASNYIKPEYTVGSFNREEFWIGHTPFVGFINSGNGTPPYQFKIKVLNNNHLFASAELHSIQEKGIVFGHIIFSTNRGDSHPDIDPTYGKIKTSDFRIRFEMTGDINKLQTETTDNSLFIKYNNISLSYQLPYISFDKLPTEIKLEKTENQLNYDVIIINRKKPVEIKLTELESAICEFVFHITSSNQPVPKVSNTVDTKTKRLVSSLELPDYQLKIETPYKPDYFEYLNVHDKQYINGIQLEHYVQFNRSMSKQYELLATSNSNISLLLSGNDSYLSKKFNTLENTQIRNFKKVADELLTEIEQQNFTIDIFKRYSIHIVMILFEKAKAESFQFDSIINNNYYDIYNKISLAPTYAQVHKLIINIITDLEKDNNIINQKTQKNTIISDIISIIDERFEDPFLSLDMISEMLGLSESYISRAFKKNTNTNYVKYLVRVRMERAKELLLEGESSETVYEKCGYLNNYSFKRAFKQYTGKNITEWLKQRI